MITRLEENETPIAQEILVYREVPPPTIEFSLLPELDGMPMSEEDAYSMGNIAALIYVHQETLGPYSHVYRFHGVRIR